MSRKHQMDEMTPLSPKDSGTGVIVHVYQDFDRRTPRGPHIKVFPGRPSAGGGVSISIPISEGATPRVLAGDTTKFTTRGFAKVIAFGGRIATC
jgi:hypothetical protein